MTANLASPLLTRAAHALVGVAFALLFLAIYEEYISDKWAYLHLVYRAPTALSYVMIVAQTAIVAAFLPLRVDRPSALVLWYLFAFVYVPSLVVTHSANTSPARFLPILFAMTAVFVAAGVFSSRAPATEPGVRIEPSPLARRIFQGVWALTTLVLLARYLPIMSFAGLDDIYEQRALALENTGGAFNYIRPWYSSILTPGLFAYGLFYRKKLDISLGLIGTLIAYAIAAQKMVLIIPVMMYLIHLSFRFRRTRTVYYTTALTALTGLCAALVNYNPAARSFADIVLMRAMAIPGLFVSQYHDYFSVHGYTWWSHVRGISLVVPAPGGLGSDPEWPALGRIVGGAYYGFSRGVNSNANLFVADGIAAAGWVGVLVIGAAMIVWLRILDVAARAWSGGFVLLALVPVAMALTNGQLTTVLLTFGGLFWTLALMFYRPSVTRTVSPSPRGMRRFRS